MFLCRLQKVVIYTERVCLRRALSFRNGMKSIQQHLRFASNIQHPQNILPDSFTTDFATIEKVWRQNQSSEIDDFLLQCFEKENDCFSYAAYLMSQTCHLGLQDKVHLVSTIVRTLELWQKNSGTFQQPTEQLQFEALMAAVSSQNHFLVQLVCDVFRINSQYSFIDGIVETCVSNRKFAEAAICAFVLKIQDRYPVEKIVLPLVLEGRMNLAIKYLHENEDLKMKLIKSLDDSLHLEKHPTPEKKLACKRLSTLLTLLEIPPETCPKFSEIHGKRSLNVLLSKRYFEKEITHSYFEEKAMELLHDSPSLHGKLIRKLVDIKDFETAVKMASTFNIPTDEWPPALKDFEANSKLPDSPHSSEEDSQHVKINRTGENKNKTEPLSLQLDKSCLKYVETAEQFEDCLNTISKNHEVVGFDSEWKPSYNFYRSKLALMQLAVKDKVYLLDFVALRACLTKLHWDELIKKIFGNPKILKLGCGLSSDIAILVRNCEGTVGVPLKFSRLLDLGIFFQKFLHRYPYIFLNEEDKTFNINNTLGLSKICAYVLGSPLKKQEQFSNWEMRPLDESQLYYAALDAYCLLQIYDKLREVSKEKYLDFKNILNVSLKLTAESPKSVFNSRKRRVKWSECCDGFEILPLIPVKEFKVLMDPKMESLGKGLRNYGVDVTFLENSMDCSDAIRLAKAEKRIILATSSLYEQFKAVATDEICHEISEDDRIAYIFQKFNVKFQADDISYKDDELHSTKT